MDPVVNTVVRLWLVTKANGPNSRDVGTPAVSKLAAMMG